MDVDRRGAGHMRALRLRLVGQRRADLARQLDVPAGAERDADTERRRIRPLSEPPPRAPFGPSVIAQLVDAEARNRRERPEILARQQAHLLGERHLLHAAPGSLSSLIRTATHGCTIRIGNVNAQQAAKAAIGTEP